MTDVDDACNYAMSYAFDVSVQISMFQLYDFLKAEADEGRLTSAPLKKPPACCALTYLA